MLLHRATQKGGVHSLSKHAQAASSRFPSSCRGGGASERMVGWRE